MLNVTNLIGFGSQKPPATLQFITSQVVNGTAVSTPTTWSNVNIGTFESNSYLVVCGFIFANAGSRSISGITVAGVSVTDVVRNFGPAGDTYSSESSIFITPAPSSSTVTIVLSVSGTTESRAVALYKLTSSSSTAFATASSYIKADTGSPLNVVVPLKGAVIGCSLDVNGTNPSWTNLTKDLGVDIRSGEWASTASTSAFLGSSPLTVTSSQRDSLSLASWI